MGQAIGQALPIAVGVALSPFPIIAVVLMLVTERGRVNGPAFVAGWILGLAGLGAIVLSVAGAGGASDEGQPATWVSVLELVLGLAVLLLALRQWRGRPDEAEAPAAPRWMGALDSFTPLKSAGAGVALSALNPKNLLLTVGGAAAIAQTGIPAGQEVVAYAVFVLVATLGVGAPVAIAFALGDRSRPILDGMKDWLGRNNAVIMAVLLLVIGVKLVGDGISGF